MTGSRPHQASGIVVAITLLLSLPAVPVWAQDTLYGVRGTSLITINPLNPSQVTTIGATNLAATNVISQLTYHPGLQALFGIGTTVLGGGADYLFNLVRINPLTGAGTVVANLGNLSAVGPYGGLEYVAGTLNSLVVTRGPANSFATLRLYTISATSGLTTQLFSSLPGTTDNDTAVYDSTRDIFYTMDANTAAVFERINLTNGQVTPLSGSIPSTTFDAAYSPTQDAFYLNDSTNNLYKVVTNGVGSISLTTVGTVSGGKANSLAIVPGNVSGVPETGSAWLFLSTLPLGTLWRWRKK